jgi:peptide/nickel transport system substrate-binding protein
VSDEPCPPSRDFQLPRRVFLRGAALCLAFAGAPGCERRDGAAQRGSPPERPSTERELVVAFDGAGVSNILLDPHNSGYAPHNRVMRSIYDNLTRLRPDQSVGPWLAESWEISADRTVYEFRLREGVRFHDGAPFDAEAVKANLDRVADPKNALSSRTSLGPYLRSEVLDARRVRVHLAEPYTPLLRHLSMTKLAMLSPAALAKHGPAFNLNPVGTGPFRFARLVPGRAVYLERNPDYQWAPPDGDHRGPGRVAKLTFMNVPEESTRIATLESGQAHAADLVPAQNLAAFRSNPRFSLLEKELLNTNYALTLNVSREPWNEADMRLAVRLALDIDAIVRTIYFGNFTRAWSLLSPSMFGSGEQELRNSWRPDPERAKALLSQQGWLPGADGIRERQGKKLDIRFVDSQGNREKRLDVMQLVRHQLKSVGIRLTIDSQPGGVTSAAIAQNNYDLAAGASFHADPDILRQSFSPALRSTATANKVVDEEIITWLDQAAREPDGPARAALYAKVQRKALDQTYAIPIYVLPYNVAASRDVAGVTIDAHGFPEFHGAHFTSP